MEENQTNKIHFIKMTGAGNDFVLIDNRSVNYSFDWTKLAPKICDRRFGVGADGLIILGRSDKADFKMDYFNSDGSFGGMCGNGGRCSALFFMDIVNSNSVKFEALDFIYAAEAIADNKIKLKMKKPNSLRLNVEITLMNEKVIAHFIDTGAPNTVLFLDELPNIIKSEINENGIKRIGSLIRHHDKFAPEGTNVNFIEVIDAYNIIIRTYERGVEAETYACGTGAIASSVIASIVKNIDDIVNVKTRSGETLTVRFDKEGVNIKNVELVGSAKEIFEGDYYIR
ncbi:MAG: diaminopimelate epimerase [Ignavibacteriales bacterium]|nr:diaminopimelate epimerase [Ignavibacteriales bacterium]